LRYTHIQYN